MVKTNISLLFFLHAFLVSENGPTLLSAIEIVVFTERASCLQDIKMTQDILLLHKGLTPVD